MVRTKSFIALLITFFMLYSCSKERQIEKWLYKKDGNWNITKATNTNYEGDEITSKSSFDDYGSFKFDKDGTGLLTIEDEEIYLFVWKNTDKKLIIVIDNEAMSFDILKDNKLFMKLEHTETYSSSTANYKYVQTFELERQ